MTNRHDTIHITSHETSHDTSRDTCSDALTIDCADCTMQATSACADCVVTFLCDRTDADAGHRDAIVFDLAERRAVRWFADAGLVPTLRHRAASNH